MNNDTTYQFVKRGTLHINDQYILIADPCYLNSEPELEAAICVPNWLNKTVNCFTVTEKTTLRPRAMLISQKPDSLAYESQWLNIPAHPRAMIVTLHDMPPAELLQPQLIGAFAFVDYVGVDSGRIVIASDDDTQNAQFVDDTFLGDGQYPVAVWGENGHIHTIAVLTDRAYYDEGWQD